MILDITGVQGATTYRGIIATVRAYSTPNPFAAGDSLAVFLQRNGDKGDSGGTPTQQQIRDAVGVMGVVNGGTGANTAAGALSNLGAAAAADVVYKSVLNTSYGTKLSSSLPPAISSMSGSNGNENKVPLIISNGGNASASSVVQFLRDGTHAVFFGLDTDNKLKVGGFSLGANAYEIFHQGNFNPASYLPLSGATMSGDLFFLNNKGVYGKNTSGVNICMSAIGTDNALYHYSGGGGFKWANSTGSTIVASMTDGGAFSAVTVTQTSDERKKMNWTPLTDDQLRALAGMQNVGMFDWVNGLGRSLGGSAQEIYEIVPEAIHFDEEGGMSVNYGGLDFVMGQGILRVLKEKGLL
jgi:hypothetical protein